MNKRVHLLSVFVILAMALGIAGVVNAETATPIYSDWEYPAPPTIDGNFTPGEWTNPQLLIQALIHTYVYFKNDNSFLYILVDAAGDITPDDDDHCDLFFDTGHDEVRTLGHEDWFRIYGDGRTDHCFATSTAYIKHCTFSAVDHPGLDGAAGFGGSPNTTTLHRIYEFKIPLSLLGASPGDTIGFASPEVGGMTQIDPPTSLPYDADTGWANIWPPGADFIVLSTWGDLVLAPPPPAAVGGEAYPVNKLAILAPWIALATALMAGGIILKRRRVHS